MSASWIEPTGRVSLVRRDAGERTVDGREGGIVAMGGVGGIEAMVAEALVLGDGNAALLERVVHVVEGGKVEAEAVLARREEGVGGDDGARHCGVGQAEQPSSRAHLRVADEVSWAVIRAALVQVVINLGQSRVE